MAIDVRPGRVHLTPTAALSGVWKRYPDGTVALRDLYFDVGPGESVGVTGSPGSGASTLLRILSGRSLPTEGTVRVLGVALDPALPGNVRRLRGMVGVLDGTLHQAGAATVGEAVRVGERARAGLVATDALDLVGGPDPYKRLGDLDATDRRRVAVAIVAAKSPDLIVADDPWRNADPGEALALARLVCRVAAATGAALVVAGGDAGGVDGVERVVRLRDGRIVG